MPEYEYECGDCKIVETSIERFMSTDEDNARPESERPRCTKCGKVMRRIFLTSVSRVIWLSKGEVSKRKKGQWPSI